MRPDYCLIGGEPCQSMCKEPCSVAKQATPHETLIAQLLDSRVPKTEREHAAAREIQRLRDKNSEPAAFINFTAVTGERNVSFVWESELASIPLWPEPPRVRRPALTVDEIKQIWIVHDLNDPGRAIIAFTRAIERAHGIGGEDATVAPPAVQAHAQDGRVAQPGVQLKGDANG